MKKISFTFVFCMIGMMILSACAQRQSTSSPTSIPVETTPGGQTVITLDDNGKTINLKVGDAFLLKLGEGYTWNLTINDPNIISRVKNIAVIRGAQGVYNAIQAGTATLTATGDPECLQSQPACAMPSVLFEVTMIVQ